MTIQEMCQRKQQLGYSYEKIAELSNLPLSTAQMYTFEHQVPVRIFDGKCIIDFKEIFEYAEFLYENQ